MGNTIHGWIPFYSGHWYDIKAPRIFIPKTVKRIWCILTGNDSDSGIYYNKNAYIGIPTTSNIDLSVNNVKETRLLYVEEYNNCYEYRLDDITSSGDNHISIFGEF